MRLPLPFLIDLLILGVLILAFWTQVIWPLWKGTRLFPWFNKDRSLAMRDLAEKREKKEVASIRKSK